MLQGTILAVVCGRGIFSRSIGAELLFPGFEESRRGASSPEERGGGVSLVNKVPVMLRSLNAITKRIGLQRRFTQFRVAFIYETDLRNAAVSISYKTSLNYIILIYMAMYAKTLSFPVLPITSLEYR